MQFCEDIEKVIKEYTRTYRDPKSHKNHKHVMAQIKRISKACRSRVLQDILVYRPSFVKKIQGCFLPSL